MGKHGYSGSVYKAEKVVLLDKWRDRSIAVGKKLDKSNLGEGN